MTMKNDRRRFQSGILNHCYQNTVNGHLLFYNTFDGLVYFTAICTYAKKHNVRVTSLCLMPDHIHSGLIAVTRKDLSLMVQDVSKAYSLSDSKVCGREGPLFNIRFGSAPKIGAKKARTNIIYIGNNPVERQLCSTAVEYRWNFLAYADDRNPFSDRLVIRNASWAMRKAIKEVRAEHKRNVPLSYIQLKRLFKDLDKKERLQLVDFIITTYNVIDYKYSARLFDGVGNMIEAMNYNTGSEYDINELFVGKSDKCYSTITNWLMQNLKLDDIHDIFSLSENTRADLMYRIHNETGINLGQLAKYLRLGKRQARSVNARVKGREGHKRREM